MLRFSKEDRRRTPRFAVPVVVYANVGRFRGTLLNISGGGCCVRHTGALKREEHVRFRTRFRTLELSLEARVLGTTIVGLGSAATYETRLAFIESAATREAIAQFVESIEELRQHEWIRNAEGMPPDPKTPSGPADFFLRMILDGKTGWQDTRTADPTQPPHGITVPSTLARGDVELLREAYEIADAPGRELLRAMAEAACKKR